MINFFIFNKKNIMYICSFILIFTPVNLLLESNATDLDSSEQMSMMEQMSNTIQTLQKESEDLKKYNEEQDKIKQLSHMFNELEWIIQKNAAYIKDWGTNYDCLVAKESVSILDKDIQQLITHRDKVISECKDVDPNRLPSVYQLCKDKMKHLNNTIKEYEGIKETFKSKCK